MANQALGIGQTGQDIFPLQPGVTLQQGLEIIPSRQLTQNMLYRQTPTTNDRLATKDFWIDGDTFQKAFSFNALTLLQ
jgi:hypothetical protein